MQFINAIRIGDRVLIPVEDGGFKSLAVSDAEMVSVADLLTRTADFIQVEAWVSALSKAQSKLNTKAKNFRKDPWQRSCQSLSVSIRFRSRAVENNIRTRKRKRCIEKDSSERSWSLGLRYAHENLRQRNKWKSKTKWKRWAANTAGNIKKRGQRYE